MRNMRRAAAALLAAFMMTNPLDCPHCASSDVAVAAVEYEQRPAFAVCCRECGAMGPPSHSDDPAHAVATWNRRMGRLSVVE
jgi:Lar family restriction alleviation protein